MNFISITGTNAIVDSIVAIFFCLETFIVNYKPEGQIFFHAMIFDFDVWYHFCFVFVFNRHFGPCGVITLAKSAELKVRTACGLCNSGNLVEFECDRNMCCSRLRYTENPVIFEVQ